MLLWPLAGPAASAQEPVAPEAAAPADPETEARLLALEAELLRLEAELAAASSPPPPPPPPAAANALNPRITAFGDLLASVGVHDGEIEPGSGPWLRSLELDLRADVDPFAKAVAVFAVHQEDPLAHDDEEEPAPGAPDDEHAGEAAWTAVPEEVYVDFVALPGGFSARAGQFRAPFGIANKAHPHDLPWTAAPAPLAHVLGHEGYADVGLLVDWRVPNPLDTGITLQAAALRGDVWEADAATAVPAWLGRAELFHSFGRTDVAVGGSATGLGPRRVAGVDLTVRYKANQWRSFVLVAEALAEDDGARGGYAALQVQPTRPLYLGLLVDTVAEAPDAGFESRGGGFVSYYTSEFLRLRAGVVAGHELRGDLQLTFVWGSHPTEPYWVNR